MSAGRRARTSTSARCSSGAASPRRARQRGRQPGAQAPGSRRCSANSASTRRFRRRQGRGRARRCSQTGRVPRRGAPARRRGRAPHRVVDRAAAETRRADLAQHPRSGQQRSWPRASSPSTGTGESSTTAAVRSGYRRAYSAATSSRTRRRAVSACRPRARPAGSRCRGPSQRCCRTRAGRRARAAAIPRRSRTRPRRNRRCRAGRRSRGRGWPAAAAGSPRRPRSAGPRPGPARH